MLRKIGLAASVLALAVAAPLPAFAAKTELIFGATAENVGNLDPHYATSTSDRSLVAWVFGGLVRFAPGSTSPASIEGDLAESWEASDDRLVWTFKLRKGVQWQGNYGEVTAEDVMFSLEKARDPKRSAFAGDFKAFKSIEAVDPYTVRIVLSERIPSLLGAVTSYSGGFIISKKAYEERGDNFRRSPIGFGPFRVESITPGQNATFLAHETYFRGKPKLTKVVYRFLSNAAARDLAFAAKEIDTGGGHTDQRWLDRALKTPGIAVDVFDPAELTMLHVNVTKPPFDNPKVRQALAHAVDAAKVVQFRGPTVTRPGKSAVPSADLGFTTDNGLYATDPAKARKLLAEAGYPNGLEVTMLASQLPNLERSAQIIQEQLGEGGFNLKLQPVEHATWHQMIRKDLSPLVLYGAARFPVADNYLTQFFHSSSIIGKPTAIVNFSHCEVADKQIEQARSEPDQKKQIALWEEAQKLIITNVCAVPVIETGSVMVRTEKLNWGYDFKGSMSLGPLITEQTHFVD